MRRLASSRSSAAALLVLSAAFLVCAAEYTLRLDHTLREVLNHGAYDSLMLGAAAVCIARGVARRRDRAAWILVGLGLALWGIGDVYWAYAIVDDPNAPYPSLADAGYLALYPPVYVAIFLLLRSRVGSLRGSLWLDGVIGGLALASFGTAVVFQAVLHATGGPPAAVATNLAYPLADLTLSALVVWALAVMGWRPGRSWLLIAAGLLVFSASDCAYLYETAVGTYVHGSLTDLGWVAGGLCLAWAAWQPEPKVCAEARLDGWHLLFVPAGFGLAALAMLVYDHFHRVNELPLTLAGTAVVALIARMGLMFGENIAMIARTQREARTDELTGLGNRRKLLDDLEAKAANPDADVVLVLFDLNGFKAYNDAFGHPAGDALLARLGHNLSLFVTGRGTAYRMGGDEFCIVIDSRAGETELVIAGAARALSEHGEGFAVSAASGSAVIPDEADTAHEALRIADQRMYIDKATLRSSAGEQSASVLLRALSERHPRLGDHAAGVAELAAGVARKLELPADDVARAHLTGTLHDIGKMAIPDAILDKPAPLSPDEWAFVRRHTLIAERIVLAAPALAHVAGLVRSSHERFDGGGYPDHLSGTHIPLISRIVFVCDAFDAMTSKRPFGESRTIESALSELQRNAGTQFDPVIVAAFADVVADRGAPRIALAS